MTKLDDRFYTHTLDMEKVADALLEGDQLKRAYDNFLYVCDSLLSDATSVELDNTIRGMSFPSAVSNILVRIATLVGQEDLIDTIAATSDGQS